MRYEHFLYKSKPSPWPSAMLCVSAEVEWIPSADTPGREICTLQEWHMALCERRERQYVVSRTASGVSPDGFWDAMRVASLRTRNLWIISTRFREVAAVLGLWDRMES